MTVKQQIEEYWDWRSTSYTNGATSLGEEERELWKQSLFPYLGQGPLKVLDIGTGRGFLALLLADMGHEVTAIDISQSMLEKAQREAIKLNLDIKFEKGDAENLAFADSSFDVVVSKYLLWTLPEPENTLKEWRRVLLPEGKIIAIDGNWFDPSPVKKFKRRIRKILQGITHRDPTTGVLRQGKFNQYYSPLHASLPLYSNVKPESIRPLFEKAGFEDMQIDSLPLIHKYNLKNMHPLLRPLNTDTFFLISGTSSKQDK
ncbi:class I SAM-dependent methyltransferase [Methanohalophilus mahii]|uniref:Methyltransferase type 11 n=1 Tax=Methanohalophilus mahii (strain ATCC 35705 / DSM 5219 / SLP) TaxID=547558 RepID=D5E8S2_METMS|nr:class I SAM-dependent methyltransferase [Methanohalophilus mahii]ADE35581.1 Methyltransferase type 11 [Methanohalophilus mahii DSM 5219]